MNAAERQRIFVDGLQAKIHLLEQSVATQRSVLQDRDAEIARLRAALKPFEQAGYAAVVGANQAGLKDSAVAVVRVTVGDCRAALKALGEEG